MADETSDLDKELGRRLSASRGYRRESVAAFAERLKVDRHDLAKWELGDFGSQDRRRSRTKKRRDALTSASKATGLPYEFFVVDFSRLSEMHAAWQQVRDEASTPESLAEALEKDEAGILPRDPSESPIEEQEL